jgi:glycosyltransferase involved in cell wall biosynthesis
VLKILHIINGSDIGGAERLLLALLARHDRTAVDITVCNTFFSGGAFVEEARAAGHRVLELPASGATLATLPFRLVGALRRGEYDVVHGHLVHSSILSQFAARLAGHPRAILTRHYTEEGYAGKGPLMRALDVRAARSAAHLIAVSDAVREHLMADGVPEHRITVIHNGIDLRELDAGLAAAERPAAQPLHFGTVGSLNARKGHATLLRAFAQLPPQLDARLTIVGEGPERQALEALLAELGIGDRARLAGYRSDVTAFLKSLDVYVQPSIQESFGISVLEAMAARLPVVASRTGGIPEIVEDEVTGLLVEPGNAGELAAALVRIAGDAALRQRLVSAARARVESSFSIDAAARRYEELYRALVASSEKTAT